LFFILSKGWNVTVQQVDRNNATNLTLVMGLVYLMYSAYFLSSDFAGMKTFVDGILAFIYFLMFVSNIKSLYIQISIVKRLIIRTDGDMPAAFQESLRLKL
jgi:hypothetical protein